MGSWFLLKMFLMVALGTAVNEKERADEHSGDLGGGSCPSQCRPPCHGPGGRGPVVKTSHRLLMPSGISLRVPRTRLLPVRACTHIRMYSHTHAHAGTCPSLALNAVPADLHTAPTPAQRGPCRRRAYGSPAVHRHLLPGPAQLPPQHRPPTLYFVSFTRVPLLGFKTLEFRAFGLAGRGCTASSREEMGRSEAVSGHPRSLAPCKCVVSPASARRL